jgi:hypothetical protein
MNRCLGTDRVDSVLILGCACGGTGVAAIPDHPDAVISGVDRYECCVTPTPRSSAFRCGIHNLRGLSTFCNARYDRLGKSSMPSCSSESKEQRTIGQPLDRGRCTCTLGACTGFVATNPYYCRFPAEWLLPLRRLARTGEKWRGQLQYVICEVLCHVLAKVLTDESRTNASTDISRAAAIRTSAHGCRLNQWRDGTSGVAVAAPRRSCELLLLT